MMIKKHKKVCKTLDCIEIFLTLVSTFNRYVSVSAFASLIGITIGITSSAIRLNICAITAGIEKFKLIIKKKEKHDENLNLNKQKSKLNIGVLLSKAFIDSVIIHDKFVWISNFLKEYTEMKDEIKKLRFSYAKVYRRFYL